MQVIPKPTESYLNTKGIFQFDRQSVTVECGPFSISCLTAFGERHSLNFIQSTTAPSVVVLYLNNAYQPEEYTLQISPAAVTITAAEERGVIWALTSLSQLLDESLSAPCCQINDRPRYAHRGLSLDCARHFFQVSDIKRIIEQMSLVKMNVLHWHLTDDQGWRIESKKYPRLHQQHGNEFYTQAEIAELVAFARIRGIEIIPEVDMPGHVSALLTVYPQHSCSGQPVQLATCGGIYPIVLCAGRDTTYQLIGELLEEICPLFPSSSFHIGGDEAPKREWKNCPDCQQAIQANILQNEKNLQGYFSNQVIKLLAQHGKTAICWNDSLEESNLEPSAWIQYWSVQYAEHLAPFVERGGQFVYSDMFAFYLDYPHSMTSLQRLYESPADVDGTDFTDNPALLGLEVCIWSERLTDLASLAQKLFPRLYAAAEKMWSHDLDYADFHQRLKLLIATHHPADLDCVPESGWNPIGEARRQQTMAFISQMNQATTSESRAMTAEHFQPNAQFQRRFAQSFFDPSDLALLMKKT